VIVVLLATVALVAAVPPSFTVAPDRNPVPVIVMSVPPLVVPELGAIEVTVGAGFGEGAGVLPPPQPGNKSARSNRELTGKFLYDIGLSLADAGAPCQSQMDVRRPRRRVLPARASSLARSVTARARPSPPPQIGSVLI